MPNACCTDEGQQHVDQDDEEYDRDHHLSNTSERRRQRNEAEYPPDQAKDQAEDQQGDENGDHVRHLDKYDAGQSGKGQTMNEDHQRCECHECTQARYRMSFQYQVDPAFLRPRHTKEDEAGYQPKLPAKELM